MPSNFRPAAGLLLLLLGGLIIRAELNRTPPASVEEQRALYEINWKNFTANCQGFDAASSQVLQTFCRDLAAHLGGSPECDPGCKAATSSFAPAR